MTNRLKSDFQEANDENVPNRASETGDEILRLVEASEFPQYAYGVMQAALLARRLNVPAITVAELGVAGGNGLLELERLSCEIGEKLELRIHPFGFDLVHGMPQPVDYRDLPYIWQPGFFRMDEELLRARLTVARLVLGDIAETGPQFIETLAAPLGFIAFDFDYYSSTISALNCLLNDVTEKYLPRVFCYFDDTVGPHEEVHSEYAGELLAISEYNGRSQSRKIAKINGLRYKLLPIDDAWIEGSFVLHIFDHPTYNRYVYPESDRQFPLEPSRKSLPK